MGEEGRGKTQKCVGEKKRKTLRGSEKRIGTKREQKRRGRQKEQDRDKERERKEKRGRAKEVREE